MAARTLGWAQRAVGIAAATTSSNTLGAVTNTSVNPHNAGIAPPINATDQSFEVTAGSPITIRWGGQSGVADQLGWDLTTNTTTFNLKAFYETGQSAFQAAAQLDTSGGIVGTGTTVTFDKNTTFTPTTTGTMRLYVESITIVTAGSTAFSNANTDAGNFGSPAENLRAGATDLGFTPGLVRVGTTLVSAAINGTTAGTQAGQPKGGFGDSLSQTYVFGAAPRASDAAGYATGYRDSTGTLFAATVLVGASGTSTTFTSGATTLNNAFHASDENDGIIIVPQSSALSTANGGTGRAFTHWTTIPSTPGTVTSSADTSPGTGIVQVNFDRSFFADPRLGAEFYMQRNDKTLHSPPDNVSDLLNYDVNFMGAADLGYMMCRLFRIPDGVGVNGISWLHSFDDLNGQVADVDTQTNSTSTQGGQVGWENDGGVNNFFVWNSVKPAGTWVCKRTIQTSTATGLATTASATPSTKGRVMTGATSLFSFNVSLGQSYTADKYLEIIVADEVGVGSAATVLVTYRDNLGVALALDQLPTMRVYSTDGTGTDTTLTSVTMSQIGATNVYTATFTPTGPGNLNVEIRALFSGGGVTVSQPVTARSRFDNFGVAGVGGPSVLIDRTGVN